MRRPAAVTAVAVTAVVVLAFGSTVAVAAVSGALRRTSTSAAETSCAAPDLPGTVVDVTLVDMGDMMAGHSGMGRSTSGLPVFPMRVLVTPNPVSAGTVSFRVHNVGSRMHELLVLPLGAGNDAGQRTVGPDGRIDEAGSIGEASRSCGPGPGEGIAPETAGWVSLTLGPGRYELVCDLANHYGAGMHAALTVGPQ